MLLLTAATLALFSQTAVSVPDQIEAPVLEETWELSYDVAITPFIEDYRRCLNYGNRVASGEADFEAQHRSDIPRCAKVFEKSVDASNRMMERRGRADRFTPEDVERAFDTVGYIHVQRGRFIDDRFKQRRAALAYYRSRSEVSTGALDGKPDHDYEEEDTSPNAED